MRTVRLAMTLGLLAVADTAQAATIVILTDPMTLTRRTLVYSTPGRDRMLLCMAPPSEAGCSEVPIKRRRR